MTLNVLSLFSGIGGLELGLERAGMTVVGQVEINPFCQKVLAKHWPDVPRHNDVRTAIQWWESETRPHVDLVCGGFPCQDISTAGKRAGIQGDRSGLWSEMFNIIRHLRPRYALMENVAALAVRGLDRVLADLASAGFDAEWSTVSACTVGASHPRERLFILAHTGCVRLEGWPPEAEGRRGAQAIHTARQSWLQRGQHLSEPRTWGVANGFPDRVDRTHSIGNSVVPQVSELVGRLLLDAIEVAA